MKNTKWCASCRSGEIKQEADYYVQGYYYCDNDRKIPYQAYICDEHYTMMTDDGAELRIVFKVKKKDKKEAGQKTRDKREAVIDYSYKDRLTRKCTAYDTFEELCRNNATIRPISADLIELGRLYQQATGRKPF